MSICLTPLYNIITGNLERSNLYLKLFKLVFGSVSLFAAENEQMLKVRLMLHRALHVDIKIHTHYYNSNLIWRTLSCRVDEVKASDHLRHKCLR